MGMEYALQELPLALFSTLAPMGAGAFTLLAVAFFTCDLDEAALKKVDRLTVIPLIFVVVGFICAFFHLASPFNAFGVFSNVGSSPMSNEILMGVIFCVVAIIYWIIVLAAKLSDGLRKGLCTVVAILGLVFCIFVGLAYGMDTIPSWDNFAVPLSTLFYGLLGGCAVGMTVIYGAGCASADAKSFNTVALVLSWCGAIGSALFFALNMGIASGVSNNMMLGSDVIGLILPWVITAIVVIILAGVALMLEIRKVRASFYPWIAVVVAFIGILIARLAFYAAEISIGLSI